MHLLTKLLCSFWFWVDIALSVSGGIIVWWGLRIEKKAEKLLPPETFKDDIFEDIVKRQKAELDRGWRILMAGIVFEVVAAFGISIISGVEIADLNEKSASALEHSSKLELALHESEKRLDPRRQPATFASASFGFTIAGYVPVTNAPFAGDANLKLRWARSDSTSADAIFGDCADLNQNRILSFRFDTFNVGGWKSAESSGNSFTLESSIKSLRTRPLSDELVVEDLLKSLPCCRITIFFVPSHTKVENGSLTLVINSIPTEFSIPSQEIDDEGTITAWQISPRWMDIMYLVSKTVRESLTLAETNRTIKISGDLAEKIVKEQGPQFPGLGEPWPLPIRDLEKGTIIWPKKSLKPKIPNKITN